MNFREWLSLHESFALPYGVMEEMYNFLLDSYKKRIESPKTPIRSKVFDLDLSGTRYEFLNKFHPSVSLNYVSRKLNMPAWYSGMKSVGASGSKFGNIPMYQGDISIGYGDNWADHKILLEHELLHFIQDLIKEHQRLTKKNKILASLYGILGAEGIKTAKQYLSFREKHGGIYDGVELPLGPWTLEGKSASEFFKQVNGGNGVRNYNPSIGGLPARSIVKKVMKDKNINVHGKVVEKRTHHHMRPIEFYTNLNSLIRILKVNYMKHMVSKGVDPAIAAVDIENKKLFFSDELNDVHGYTHKKMQDVKRLDKDLYKKYMNTITKDFIFDDKIDDYYNIVNRDEKGIKDFSAELVRRQEKESLERKNRLAKTGERAIKGTKYTAGDFKGTLVLPAYGGSMFDQLSNTADREENVDQQYKFVMYSLGKYSKKKKESEMITWKLDYNKLQEIFKSLRENRKARESDPEKWQKVTLCNWDHMVKKFADYIYEKAFGGTVGRPTGSELLSMFYGPVSITCNRDASGYFIPD